MSGQHSSYNSKFKRSLGELPLECSSKCWGEFGRGLVRQKYYDQEKITESKLARVLGTLDLTALGIGSTLGAGVYVVAGQVARQTAGPAVVISFLIAAVASVLSGLCYAEFGARVPKSGSAYIYSYVTIGELWAFIIGWNLILEYVIGAASVARAWSAYFDSLLNNTIENYLSTHIQVNVPGLSNYPDFFALAIILVLTAILCIGVRESSALNNVFTAINLLVVLFVIVSGLFQSDIDNWRIPADRVPNETVYMEVVYQNGVGGFMPFGFTGMMSGAATCFYAFIGFDVIATTGVVDALLSSSRDAPSLLGSMFPMPRVIYAMASDGLLFRFLAHINERFKTPIIATVVSGLLAGFMTTIFDLKELVDMMSIGTLLAYTLVSCCVLILRYRSETLGRKGDGAPNLLVRPESQVPLKPSTSGDFEGNIIYDESELTLKYLRRTNASTGVIYSKSEIFTSLFKPLSQEATVLSGTIVAWAVAILAVLILLVSILLNEMSDQLMERSPGAILLVSALVLMIVITVFVIIRQPQSKAKVLFMVPFVPFIPSLSIFINLYLMTQLSIGTWIRFSVWMFAGFLIYFLYGIWHSIERRPYRAYELTAAENEITAVENESGIGLLSENLSQPSGTDLDKKTIDPDAIRAEFGESEAN
ncbi:PREDICTED: cationic amino acid transporter 2-like [Priapulus caudatus]|uniref:Cationic amino acid transporter 2-like n=1 Tax=Priapulus caudatus TaxID=37621 RepID=A0ABM1E835_PRICU|nr:PREDICTED: cationic amino acid transporter 2-like [Priapulus caudatus]